jgi:hypothetical protein
MGDDPAALVLTRDETSSSSQSTSSEVSLLNMFWPQTLVFAQENKPKSFVCKNACNTVTSCSSRDEAASVKVSRKRLKIEEAPKSEMECCVQGGKDLVVGSICSL